MKIKPLAQITSVLKAVAVLALIALTPNMTNAADRYWSANGTTQGGAGTWDTTNTRWGSAATGAFTTVWNNTNIDTARFGGTAGVVALGTTIDVGGLWFDATAYPLTTTGYTLNFAATDNTITLNNIAAATITGPVGGSGNVTLTTPNPTTAGTLTFSGTSTGGWSGTTTVNPGMRLEILGSSSSQALRNTSAITFNGGTIALGGAAALVSGFDRINNAAVLTSNGGTITYDVNNSGVNAETVGSLDLVRGQFNLTEGYSLSSGTQTFIFSGLSRTGTGNSSALNLNAKNTAFTTGGNNRVVVGGVSANTPAGEIVGPWFTTLYSNAAATDYIIYSNGGSGSTYYAIPAGIVASAESTWSTDYTTGTGTLNNTLANANGSATSGRLTATRNINSLRNTTAVGGTISIATGTDIVTMTGSTFSNGDVIVLGTGNAPLVAGVPYYVRDVSGATFKLAATSGGTAIDITANSGGTLTAGITLGAFNLGTYGILNGSAVPLVIGGNGGVVTLPTTTAGNLHVNTGSGAITINAPITDNGGAVTVVKNGSTGRLVLSGNNTFTGGLVVNSGVTANSVRLVGTQSFTGGITLNGGGIGENSANATPTTPIAALNGNAITVNGPSHLVLEPGTLSTTSTITINGTGVLSIGPSSGAALNVPGLVSGNGVLDVNPSSGNYSGSSVNLTHAANTFSGNVIYGSTQGQPYVLNVNSLGDSGKVIFGFAGGNSTFALNTGAAALTFNTRQFELVGATGANNLPKIGNNSTQTFTINTDLLATGTGTRTLQLQGTGAGLSTFNGVLANGNLTSLALTKAETGTWALTKANTYTGATTISGGTLQIGNGSTTGSLSTNSAITITSPGTLAFNRSNAVVQGTDFSGAAITGTGALIQSGSDTLTLNVANTFTGTTTVSAGKILMTNPLALQYSAYNTTGSNGSTIGLDVTSGLSSGTLTLGGLSGSVNLASAITAGYTGSVANLTLNPQSGTSYTYTGSIANATTGMTVTKNNAGTQLLQGNNSYTGGTILNAGAIEINNANSLGTGTITFAGTASINPTHSSYPTLANVIQVNPGAVGTLYVDNQFFSMNFAGPVTGSGTLIQLNGAGGATGSVTLSSPANTFTGILKLAAPNGKSSSLTVNSLADSANPIRFTSSTATATGNNFILGAGTATPLLFNSRQIELASATGTAGIYNNNGTAANTITINTSLLITANGAKTLLLGGSNTGANTFAGAIGNSGAGATAITKADGGLWILSGNNTYTGITTISGGTLAFSGNANVASPNPLGQSTAAAGNLLLANGTTLRYVGAAASTDRSFTLNGISNNQGASLDASGTGAINFTSTASPAYGTPAQPRTLTLTGTNTGNNTLAANLADNTTGAVSINKTGIGTWVLSGASNPFTGTTTLSGGGKLVLDYTSDTTKLANGAALILQNGGGELTLRGGSHLEAVGSLTIGTGGGHTHVTREVGSTAKLAFGVINRSQSAGCTLSLAEDNLVTTTTANIRGMLGGPITVGSNWAKNDGSGNIVALTGVDYTGLPTGAATGTVNYELSGSQIHTGSASMNSLRIVGTGATDQSLDLGANQLQLGTVTLNTVNNSGGLLYAGGGTGNYTITGTGGIQGQNGSQELIINTYEGTLTLDMVVTTGTVGGGSSLTKFGAGTLVLTKASAYASGTYVNQGTLRLANNTAAGTAAGGIFVANGAALELANNITVGTEALTITGNGVSNGGTLRNASGNNTYGGAITVGTGGTRINSASGLLTLSGGIVTAFDKHLTIGGAGNITISTAAISGTGNLTKDGAGTLTLTAANTYTGTTTINEGTLVGVVGGSCSNSAVTVASTGTLEISVTDSAKKWTCASLALNNGSQLKFSFTGAPSPSIAPLNILGSLSLSETPVIVITPGNTAPGFYPLLTVGGSVPTLVPTLSGVNGSLKWIANTLWLTIAPAPTLISFF